MINSWIGLGVIVLVLLTVAGVRIGDTTNAEGLIPVCIAWVLVAGALAGILLP